MEYVLSQEEKNNLNLYSLSQCIDDLQEEKNTKRFISSQRMCQLHLCVCVRVEIK